MLKPNCLVHTYVRRWLLIPLFMCWKARPKWELEPWRLRIWDCRETLCDGFELMWIGCYPTWAFILPLFFIFFHLSSSNHFLLLDLVRPFLDLVRSHAGSIVFLFRILTNSAPEFSDVEFGLRFSPFPPYSSSPSLSIPPELFGTILYTIFCHTRNQDKYKYNQSYDIARHVNAS